MSVIQCFSLFLSRDKLTLKTDAPDGIEQGIINMKRKIWIGTLMAFALLSVSVLLMVACKKKAPPQAPTGLSSYVSGSTIIVSWNSVEDADKYCIEYTSGSNYHSETVYGTSFTDYSPDNGENYYKVSAHNEYGYSEHRETSCYYGGGNGGGGSTSLDAPTGLTAEVSGSRIYITWNSVSNASYYRIRRFSSTSGYMEEIGTTSDTYYYDSSPQTGQNYYEVTSVSNKGTESSYASVECQYSNGGGGGGGGGGSAPSAPTGVSAEVSGSQIRVSWNSVSTATQYTVYRSTSASGSYTSIGTTSSTYYYDSNPSTDNYYKVKAKNSNGESSYSSYAYCHYSSGGGGGGGGSTNYAPCPPTVSASGTASSISVSWTKATGTGCGNPTSYKVYKRNPISGSYELKTTTSSTSYRDTDVHPGVNRYAVEAINSYGSDEGYGYSSSITLPRPTSFNAQKSGSDYVKFTWSKVSQATGYQIFVSTSASGNYTILDQIDDVNTTTHTRYYPGESGRTYYFKMRAIWIASGTYEYSDFTTYKSVTF